MAGKTSVPEYVNDTYADLSGVSTKDFSNPYDALIAACKDDAVQIQSRYNLHRKTRNSQQKAKLLGEDFSGVHIDQVLAKLCDPKNSPEYVDPRHCLVLWSRPTEKVKNLIERVQKELHKVAPNLWLMPRGNLHITVLEITHSRTAPEIQQLVDQIRDRVPAITEHIHDHRARLIKPSIGYDASALALSFVPAAGEGLHSGRTAKDDEYTYHHLRRDMYGLLSDAGIEIDSRYVVPSSHLTIGRFINTKDTTTDEGSPDPAKMKAFVEKIEEINGWLGKEFWPEHNDGKILDGGEFNVGKEAGLLCQMGTLWYGGGETVHQGQGY